jgi:hypothetical protein
MPPPTFLLNAFVHSLPSQLPRLLGFPHLTDSYPQMPVEHGRIPGADLTIGSDPYASHWTTRRWFRGGFPPHIEKSPKLGFTRVLSFPSSVLLVTHTYVPVIAVRSGPQASVPPTLKSVPYQARTGDLRIMRPALYRLS